jgi:uncharacterized RDD family membrane protein YckC
VTRPAAASRPAPGGRRWRASFWDYLVILGWLALLTLLALIVRLLLPPVPTERTVSPLAADAGVFLLTVLPAWVYLTATESGPERASWGKRRAGLHVTSAAGGGSSWRQVAGRNAVKLLPWQLAHVAVARIITGADEPVTIWATYALSLLLAAVSLTMAWRDPLRRALHDRVAHTRVVCV